MIKKRVVESFTMYALHGVILYHEFDSNANHRIRQSMHRGGNWTTYQGIARYKNYCATTQYYLNVLPRMFEITEAQVYKGE